MPGETAGPYPGDGSNGPDVLETSGVERSDLTTSIDSDTTADGVPLEITMNIIDMAGGDIPMEGAAVYLWQCDAAGRYSMYSEGVENETYLRGVQIADSAGQVTFTSIFPAAYDGRWPHVHFEVYPTLAKATSAADKIITTQLALPEAVCRTVYATDGYSQSSANLAKTSLTTDMVFRDGWTSQLATVTGGVSEGYVANLTVPV